MIQFGYNTRAATYFVTFSNIILFASLRDLKLYRDAFVTVTVQHVFADAVHFPEFNLNFHANFYIVKLDIRQHCRYLCSVGQFHNRNCIRHLPRKPGLSYVSNRIGNDFTFSWQIHLLELAVLVFRHILRGGKNVCPVSVHFAASYLYR